MSIRVLVADDQSMVRAGFRMLLSGEPDIEVVGEASNGIEAVDKAARFRPTVVLMDIRMPELDGLQATRRILSDDQSTRVLILTTFDLDEYVFDALQAGASGFLLKDVTGERLIEGVRLVADGSMLLGPQVTRRLVDDFAARRTAARPPAFDTLTARETDVLLAVARGLSNAEVAAALFIGEQTVKSHVSEVLRKLGCRDRVQLVITAYESGLVR
jgi:DNA-binding NarL/FixJ family response regulator